MQWNAGSDPPSEGVKTRGHGSGEAFKCQPVGTSFWGHVGPRAPGARGCRAQNSSPSADTEEPPARTVG